MTLDIVMTDTFGDMPNYSWVVRKTVQHTGKNSDTAIVRKVKRTLGISAAHRYYSWSGDTLTIEFYPNDNLVIFVTSAEESAIKE